MKSMTGYGKGMVAGDDFSVSVDLKTVNNRFLDIHLRVGSELASLEPVIKKRITSRLSRGRVDVTVSMERAAQIAYELNRPLIAGYVNALKQLQQDFNIAGELDINVIARIPGALQPARNGIDDRMSADRKSTRLNSSHTVISYAVFCLKKKTDGQRERLSHESDTHRRER